MTSFRKQNMYIKPVMSNLHVAGWADVAVSIYQGSNIDSRLNSRGTLGI